ncbi:MAG: ABC-type hemin uptake system ATPase component [Idiomarinaceae bacterium HL-53]|nr:MAG: ABC-type hemin uptake system ATPase component [Idiomarinaceae bacterium HL-53]CUS48013.1 iron complex transport system ATP-binding protein [Idiomarinaceae bacterium HL-53]
MRDDFLKVSNLVVRRGQRVIVKECNFEFTHGQFVAVIGENGAGKSTLLKALAGDLSYQGKIQFAGDELTQWSSLDLASRRAVMEQHAFAPPGLSVLELVAMGRYWCMEPEHQSVSTAYKWLEKLQLEHYTHNELNELSGGEQQRAHLARCMAQLDHEAFGTQVNGMLLLDEPTAALDIYYQHLCLQQAKQFAQQRNLVIAIMHDLNLASLYADQILLLHQGERCACGIPSDVLEAERLSDLYRQPMHVVQHPKLNVPMIFSEPQFSLNAGNSC